MIFKKFKWTAAKRLNWNNEGQWLGTKDQISYCLLVGLVFIHLIHMSLSRYLLDTVFVLACTIFHSERENTNVTENSRNYVSRGFKMHQGTRVDVMRCNSVTKHVYMYYGAFVLWCSSSSVAIKKPTTMILYHVLIRRQMKCILLGSYIEFQILYNPSECNKKSHIC